MTYSIVYVGAHWCVSCKKIQPQIESLAKRFQVDICIKDFDKDLSEEEQETISKVPTILIRNEDKIIETYASNQVVSVESWLRANITMNLQSSTDF